MEDQQDHLRRVNELLTAVLDVPVEQRTAFLDQACGDDGELRGELEALLAQESLLGGFLESPPALDVTARSIHRLGACSAGPEEGAADSIGHIGAYRVVGVLGRGGMGVVYHGERASGDFDQDVAIKVVRSEFNAAAIERRFLQERRILARLEHPHIAHLVDGGLTEDGRPYFAMEYVEGKPITTWCDEQGLSVGDRVDLFIQVCQAVEYAHQNLVVHRDLKPGNILVSKDGTVKLLDFGIAKVLDEADPDRFETRDFSRVMTPRYASPEQVLGQPVTTATDVYALGVVLYELLTGRVPLVSDGDGGLSVMRAIVEDDPRRPSHVVSDDSPASTRQLSPAAEVGPSTPPIDGDRLSRRLRGDLDAILMKALRKRPRDRYASVAALRQDLERHREGLPIDARSPSLGYVAFAFARRNRLFVSAASLVFLTLVVGVASTSWQARVAAAARDQAQAEARRARSVTGFMANLFQVAGPNHGGDPSMPVRQVLDRGAEMLDQQFGDQLGTKAALMLALAGVYQDLGLYDQATPLAEKSVAAFRSLGDREGLVDGLGTLCELHNSSARYDEARRCVAGFEALVTRDFGNDPTRQAELRRLQASLDRSLGHPERAAGRLRQALEMMTQAHGESSLEVASVANSLAVMLSESGQPQEAVSYHRLALEIHEELAGPRHPDTLSSMSNLGAVLETLGEYEPAEELLRRALALRREVYPSSHPYIATTLNLLAVTVGNRGRPGEAVELYLEALEIERQLLAEDHPDIARTLNNLAVAYYELDQIEKAEATLREALAVWLASLGPSHQYVDQARSNLGAVLTELGRHDEAEPLLEDVLAERRRLYGTHEQTATALFNLGRLHQIRGRTERAERTLREALSMRRQLFGDRDTRVVLTINLLAEVLAAAGGKAEAEALYREALATSRELFPEGHPRTADALVGLARLAMARGDDRREITESLRHAVAIREAAFGEAHPMTAEARRLLSGLEAPGN